MEATLLLSPVRRSGRPRTVAPVTLFPAESAARRVSLVRLASEIARATASVGRIVVEGEVHRPSRGRGGRVYFTLKDRAAQISVSCPGSRASRCRAVAGERVQVAGSLEWVSGWGSLQLVAEEVVPVGAGAVAAMIAEARERLAAAGLLTRARRPIPRLPRAIGVVCGSDAAVRADIESVVAARFDGYPLVFREVAVSGPGAAIAIIEALRDLDAHPDVEVVVLARGGGDATQLLPFSDEDLCRAICDVSLPVVSAIGHEGDRPLCDEVADLRAGTPSLAAAAVVPDLAQLRAEADRLIAQARSVVDRRADAASSLLAAIDRDRALNAGVDRARHRLSRSGDRLALLHPGRRVDTATRALAAQVRHLESLSPKRVLERGYAVVRTVDGGVVRDPAEVAGGDRLDVEVARGRLLVRAEGDGS